MSISPVTAVGGAFPANSTQSVFGQRQKTKSTSIFGPATILANSIPSIPTELYNAIGTALIANPNGVTTASAFTSSSARKELLEALTSAAAKIDGGDPQGGRAEAEEILADNANDVTAVRLVAHSYMVEQDYGNAEKFYTRAAAMAPDNARYQSDVENARSLQKSDSEVLTEARDKAKSPAHRTEALRLLLHLSNRSPESAEVYLALADGFSAAGKPVQVLGALHEAVKFAEGEEIDEVISRAKTFTRKHPGIGLPHNILGRAYQKAGRANEALAELKIATKLAPDNTGYVYDLADAYLDRGMSKLARRDLFSAESDLRLAQSIDPIHTGLSEGFARVAAERAGRDIAGRRYISSLSKLATAAAKAPDDVSFKKKVSALYNRVAAYFHNQGSDTQALSSYRKAYELDPTSAVARRYVGQLSNDAGSAAVDRKDYDAAIDHLERAYQADRGNDTYRQNLANAHDLRGQLYVTQDKLNEAIEDFKRAYSLDPTNAAIEANLASAVQQSYAT